MTMDEDDLALETLLTVAQEIAPTMDADLLRQCYAIQKKYQFSVDRGPSVSAMERVIDAHVDKTAENRT